MISLKLFYDLVRGYWAYRADDDETDLHIFEDEIEDRVEAWHRAWGAAEILMRIK